MLEMTLEIQEVFFSQYTGQLLAVFSCPAYLNGMNVYVDRCVSCLRKKRRLRWRSSLKSPFVVKKEEQEEK
jgi:hypothetical protein